MKNTVIFDLDGTLLNTIEDLGTASNYALEKHRLPIHSLNSYNQMVGNGIRNLIKRAAPGVADSEREDILKDFIWYYDRHCTDFTKPYPGIEQLLTHLSERDITMAVCSNKYQEAVSRIIKYFFPEVKFAAVYGERRGIPRKPDPTVLNKSIEEIGAEKSETLMVGDSEVDIETARRAGIDSVGVTWGFRSPAQVAEAHPTHLVSRPQDILPLF